MITFRNILANPRRPRERGGLPLSALHWPGAGYPLAYLSILLSTALLALGAEETNSASVTGANTNLVKAIDTNSAVLRIADTHPVILKTVDTNSPGFATLETKPAGLPEPRSASRFDLRSFSIISERNIFNPNRSARSGRMTTREPEKRVTTESFALVGIMSYEKGRFAFFDSSSSQYQKVLETSGTIANYKITDITPKLVKLESTNGQAIELPVGMQMKKEEQGEWMLGARAEAPSSAEEKTEKTDKVEKTDAGATGGADDVLKKLLQKREQELNK